MSEIEVRSLDNNEYKMWNEFVENVPQGTIFHTTDWLTICSESLRQRLEIYGFFEKEKLVGGCALLIKKVKNLLTIADSSCSMTPYFGLILEQSPINKVRKQEHLYRSCIDLFCEEIKQQNLDFIHIQNSPGLMDIRPFLWKNWRSEIRYTYYLDTNNIQKSSDAKRNINNAIKNGILIEKSNDIDSYYKLFEETFKRQGLKPPASAEFVSKIFNMIQKRKSGELWIAKTKEGELAAAEIFALDNKRPHRWTAATSTELRKTGAYSLLLDTVFNEYKEKGYQSINLMAANTPQLSEFITSFNPTLVPYYSVSHSNKKYKMLKSMYNISY